jgi:multisubunit Na+/H+ antiporter MnhF subunit
MIDTWLFTALCFSFLTLCAALRVIPGPGRSDRIVSLTAAITLFAAAALVFCIATGNLLILDVAVVLVLLLFAGTIGYARFRGSDGQ